MLMLKTLPVLAYADVVIVILMVATGRETSRALRWMLPVGLGALFLVFSVVTVAREGLLLFWVNHTTNFTGNQVWFDLIFAVTIGFYLIAPRARAVGMPLMPWAIAVILTACIALLPMLARLVWLEEKARD